MIKELKKDLSELIDKKKAEQAGKYFKTEKGDYGEGDIFLGVSVPNLRKTSKKYQDLSFSELEKLLKDKIHEYREIALFILVIQYQKTQSEEEREKIVNFYIKNIDRINNWDLVDASAPKILGDWLIGKDKKILYKFAKSNNLWRKRIAVLSTYAFIRNNHFEDTLRIAKILLNDSHDLIHKAVGWMLREVGNRNLLKEETFLKTYYQEMPRTMLRYAIEKFPETKRQFYLKKLNEKSFLYFNIIFYFLRNCFC